MLRCRVNGFVFFLLRGVRRWDIVCLVNASKTTDEGSEKMKARYMVIANGKEYTFETLAAARYFAADHNTTPVRVNR